jgi:2-hydroxyacyl-CoA lyase 1
LETIPFIVNKAYQVSKAGRPGPTYVDLPADLIQATTNKLPKLPEPSETPYCLPHPKDLSAAIEILKNSKRPLLVVGKGYLLKIAYFNLLLISLSSATYSRCENELKALVEDFKVPFLPTPMVAISNIINYAKLIT